MQWHWTDFSERFASKTNEAKKLEKPQNETEPWNVENSTKSEVVLLITLKK